MRCTKISSSRPRCSYHFEGKSFEEFWYSRSMAEGAAAYIANEYQGLEDGVHRTARCGWGS